jgi:hypothetical protein
MDYFQFQSREHKIYRSAVIKHEGEVNDPGSCASHYQAVPQVISGFPSGPGGKVVRAGNIHAGRADGATLQETVRREIDHALEEMATECSDYDLEQRKVNFVLAPKIGMRLDHAEIARRVGTRLLGISLVDGERLEPSRIEKIYPGATVHLLTNAPKEWRRFASSTSHSLTIEGEKLRFCLYSDSAEEVGLKVLALLALEGGRFWTPKRIKERFRVTKYYLDKYADQWKARNDTQH